MIARRIVADRCLYGVDLNPMAVEMAKLSLWLVTLQKDRPFTFLDHALKCGDSLLGLTRVDQFTHFRIDPGADSQLMLWSDVCARALETALAKRQQLESFTVIDIHDAERKALLLAEAETATAAVRLIGNLVVAATLSAEGREALLEARLADIGSALDTALSPESNATESERQEILRGLHEQATRLLNGDAPEGTTRRPIHWAAEFPEVFAVGDSNGSRRSWAIRHSLAGSGSPAPWAPAIAASSLNMLGVANAVARTCPPTSFFAPAISFPTVAPSGCLQPTPLRRVTLARSASTR
jgi:hypothetical protein